MLIFTFQAFIEVRENFVQISVTRKMFINVGSGPKLPGWFCKLAQLIFYFRWNDVVVENLTSQAICKVEQGLIIASPVVTIV